MNSGERMSAIDKRTPARAVLDTIKILETREADRAAHEICATAVAVYDENARELRVELDAFVRRFEMRGRDLVLHPPWLPRRDTVKTRLDWLEAPDAAKEIFAGWSRKVRATIPPPEEWAAAAPWLRVPAPVPPPLEAGR